MTYPKRWYFYNRRVFFTYRYNYEVYDNSYLGGLWHCMEQWAISFGFKVKTGKWFCNETWYYDGHTYREITFAGLTFGKMFTYDARPYDGHPVLP